jgi:crotonobetainyl-CoA:carnitine CoA-transferase CaiB-like acyl-CoA transferase
MLDAVVAFLWSSDMGGQTYVGKSVSQQRAASFIDLIYETTDGYISVAVMTNAQWAALCEALERPEWLDDERFLTTELRDLNIDARLELTQSVLSQRSAADWLDRLETAGVPCAPVLTRSQVIDHPQIVAGGVVVENDHPQAGRLRQSRNAARFSTSPAEQRRGAPQLGEHCDEILAEAGFAQAEIADLCTSGVIGG